MGMFDTVWAELTCPFCGREYKYSPPSYEEAKSILTKERAFWEKEFLEGRDPDNPATNLIRQIDLTRPDTTDRSVEDYLTSLNSEEAVNEYRNNKSWGLCEIQVKEWDCLLFEYFVGDKVDSCHYGHYFVEDYFMCDGCCLIKDDEDWRPLGSVSVWIELDEHLIKSVTVIGPDTGQAKRRLWNKDNYEKDVIEYKPEIVDPEKDSS